jgi:hypothetical protein
MNILPNKQAILKAVGTNNLTGIRAGLEREGFLDIWMVVVDNRIFARSWGLSEKSWYRAFEKNPEGAIRAGVDIVRIRALIPSDLIGLNERISQAYLDKYNKGENAPYALGIIKPEHEARTMEFVPVYS